MNKAKAPILAAILLGMILALCGGTGAARGDDPGALPEAAVAAPDSAVTAGVSSPLQAAGADAPSQAVGAAPAAATKRYEQDDPRLVYSGAWTNNLPGSNASKGSFRYAYTGKASLKVEFTGTYLAWIGQTHVGYGLAKVTLDGGASFVVDLYSETTQWQCKLWDTGVLEPGDHTVVIEWTGDKNGSAGNSMVGVDAFDIAGILQQAAAPPRSEQDDARLWYQGLWNDRNAALASGSRVTFARTPSDSVTVTFNGTAFMWIGRVGPDCGIAQVTVDGEEPVLVDLYASGTAWKQTVWDAGSLSGGAHTIKIEATGTKHPESTDTVVILDAVDLDGTLERTPPPAVHGLVVFDGNSLTTGVGGTIGNDYPAQLLATLAPGRWRAHDVAVGGQTTSDMLADAATQVDRLCSSGYPRNVVVCLTGTIDRPADGNAARQAKLQSYCQGRRAAGFKVIVITLPSHNQEDYPGATRAEFNDWIRANYRSFADGLADAGADPRIGAPGAFADPVYFPDGLHLNDAGYAVVAEIVKQAFDRVPVSLRGTDRYDTAVKVSRAAFAEPLPADSGLVLAPGETFPEALCGAPLAAAYGGPVLLTPSAGLNNGVRAEIQRLAPTRVFCLGLSDAVAAAVQAAVPGASVTNIRGARRERLRSELQGRSGPCRQGRGLERRHRHHHPGDPLRRRHRCVSPCLRAEVARASR